MTPPPGVRPDHYASYTRKLQNQLHHNGIHVTLNTSDETLETLKTAIVRYEELIDRSLKLADVSSAAKFAGVLEKVRESLHRMQRDREAEGGGDESNDEETETKALEFLRRRGWRCER